MMLRVVMFEICRHYRLRLAPGATVTKNTVVTTKPAAIPIIRLPRERGALGRAPAEVRESPERDAVRQAPAASRDRPKAPAPAAAPEWGEPTEIPETSAYRHLVIAYGSNFGTNKELAGRFAERSHFYGYTSDVITLNELAESPPHTQPWLLVVMTSTYTSNPPSNATAFKSWLERTQPGGRDVAELPVPRLGAGQQPMERVPRVPPLRAYEAVRTRRHAARGVRVRRRGLARVGTAARGLEHPRLVCSPGAVRGAADGGRGGARRRREGGHGCADGRRLEHCDGQVALRRRRRAAASRAGGGSVFDHALHVVRITQAARLGARRVAGIGRSKRQPAEGAARADDPPERRRAWTRSRRAS